VNGARQILRAATADDHRRVDLAFGGFDLAVPVSSGAVPVRRAFRWQLAGFSGGAGKRSVE